MESRLSRSPFHEFFFHSGISAISKPFSWIFLSQWNLGYHEALFLNFSFTMESRLSRSLFHEFFFTMESRLSQSPFHEFFFHNGISAITKPFSRIFLSQQNLGCHEALFTNFSFTMESRLSRSPFHEFFFHNRISAITKPFSRIFFHNRIDKMHDLGEDSFHIYHKEYLHRICLVKNLASWFRAPFARKRVRSSLF
jgi:hypothetical protein